MNCKPGDWAMYVGPIAAMRGRVVAVIREYAYHKPSWYVDPPLESEYQPEIRGVLDSSLRPIRDQPGEDEMLRIAGKPQDQREPT